MYRSISLALAAACVLMLSPASLAGESPLALSEAWVRALPPTRSSTAAYLVAENTSPRAVTITGASATLAASTEIHTSRQVDGYMRMEHLPRLSLAPGERVQFAPGGMHLMLLGLERMPAEGEQVRLCLELEEGAAACVEVPVRRDGGGAGHQHHQ